MTGSAACVKLHGPKNLFDQTAIPSLIAPATPSGSYRAAHPKRHPGRRNLFESPENVMIGTEVESEARGIKGAVHV